MGQCLQCSPPNSTIVRQFIITNVSTSIFSEATHISLYLKENKYYQILPVIASGTVRSSFIYLYKLTKN